MNDDSHARTGRWWTIAVAGAVILLAALTVGNVWLAHARSRYRAEIARLRDAMTVVERARLDAVLAQEEHTLRVGLELLRRQARLDDALHLTVSVDSGIMTLEHGNAVLRRMSARVGPERVIGAPPDTVRLARPLGVRTIAALDSAAVLLDGGTLITARASGDTTQAHAGEVQVDAADLRAVLPNLAPGMRVYFY